MGGRMVRMRRRERKQNRQHESTAGMGEASA